jgi:hypothetical protein
MVDGAYHFCNGISHWIDSDDILGKEEEFLKSASFSDVFIGALAIIASLLYLPCLMGCVDNPKETGPVIHQESQALSDFLEYAGALPPGIIPVPWVLEPQSPHQASSRTVRLSGLADNGTKTGESTQVEVYKHNASGEEIICRSNVASDYQWSVDVPLEPGLNRINVRLKRGSHSSEPVGPIEITAPQSAGELPLSPIMTESPSPPAETQPSPNENAAQEPPGTRNLNGWIMPGPSRISRGFGGRHTGVDYIGLNAGDTIYAIGDITDAHIEKGLGGVRIWPYKDLPEIESDPAKLDQEKSRGPVLFLKHEFDENGQRESFWVVYGHVEPFPEILNAPSLEFDTA